jgi:hypothetical protein
LFAGFENSTSKINSIDFPMLELFLCSSCDGVPLNEKKKETFQSLSLSGLIFNLILTPVTPRWTLPLKAVHKKSRGYKNRKV